MHSTVPRCGLGFDVHPLVEGRDCIIGGVHIPYDKGLLGHSDADVLLHAVMDALLGAASLGDIGQHFPDTDARYKGVSSLLLLEAVRDRLQQDDWDIVHVDCVLMAQAPRISPYRDAMRDNIANGLRLDPRQINVKATTTEGLGFIGRVEGVAAQVLATLIARKGTP